MTSGYDTIDVLLYGKIIGAITLLPNERNVFSFSETYIENINRPTLSLSLKSKTGGFIDKPQLTKQRLPSFFSNLLPEGPLREYLARKAGVNSEREFFLLAALGQDLPGAVEIQVQNVKDKSANADTENILLSARNTRAMHFSLAGVQLKFSALRNKDGTFIIPPYGVGGNWIVKLPSPIHPLVPENEFAMMTLAGLVGIDVPPIELVSVTDIENVPEEIYHTKNKAFLVKRFDRDKKDKDVRIHMEDFAQIFGVYPKDKYDAANYSNIASVIWTEIDEKALEQFVKRLVFSALIGNGDMHLKNWSLIYPDKKHAALSPAYDLLSTVLYLENDGLALNLGGTKEMTAFSYDLLKRFSAKARIPETLVLNSAKEIVEAVKFTWPNFKTDISLPKHMVVRIEKHMKNIPLLR